MINKFSCMIIGSGTLPIRCGEILLRTGHEIQAIVSDDHELRKWSSSRNIFSLIHGVDLAKQIERPIDYLFSIVNEHILDEDILKLPRRLAINYHDGPLPRYAGTHATSWALMNGETEHGISWHVINNLVDGGDILKQRHLSITSNETAFTLNTKCYEAACEAFAELVQEISLDRLVPRKQDLKDRTFFPRFKRPSNGGVISWASSSNEIAALIRALDFGPHPNPLGTAKVVVKDRFFVVPEIGFIEIGSGSPPGTINEIGPDFLRISTLDRDVILRSLLDLEGAPIPIFDLVSEFDLREGHRLEELDQRTAASINELIKESCRHESYWVRKLSDLTPAALPLPSEPSLSPGCNLVRITVPDEFVGLARRSKSYGTMSFHLIAGFAGFLSRLMDTGRFDVSYQGFPASSPIVGFENLFADEAPIRFDIDPSSSFDELLESCRREIESVIQHRHAPRDMVLRYPQLGKLSDAEKRYSLPITVFNSAFPLMRHEVSAHELTFAISESDGVCNWIYDGHRFESDDIKGLAANFSTFLSNIVADPATPIAQLPLLTDEERHRMLIEWNSASMDVPDDQCIHHYFEAQVKRTPEAIALIVEENRLTYAELNQRANKLAYYLRSLGVGPESLVAVCLERSVDMVVAIIGILKSGGAYVPLDPAYPRTRLDQILNDSQTSVLVSTSKIIRDLGQYSGRVVDLDRDIETVNAPEVADPDSKVETSNLAYVIYTSGSTGKPKGVAIEHRSAAAFLTWSTSVFSAEQLSRTLASTSVCFDLSVFEIFAPLSCGGAIVLVENILHLPTAPAAREVTLINTVPSGIAELVRTRGIPESVLTVNLAGEPLKTSLVRQIYETGTVRQVFDLYGPSEDTTYSTFTLRGMDRATIGRPIPNTKAYVLDRHLQPLPIGIPGELYLGGHGLARGYLNQPELTAERFIGNPFIEDSSERMYKTGDLVRYLPSGEIEYLGRVDNQVKIRGFRIELGEIEGVLSSHPAVSEAVVVATVDNTGEKRLTAYFVCNDGAINTSELREHLRGRLPEFMIPSLFVLLDELPLTPNGKVDRKALPSPSATITDTKEEFVAHRDDLESTLVRIWEDILDIRPIGVKDDFFELGGHSLKAIRMFAEIEEVFGKNIPLATLFEAGTVEKLAGILRQDGWAAPESSLVPIQPNGTRPPFFCVHAKGGNVLFYQALAKYVGTEQPFYGLQARRLAGRQIGHETVEEMADFYIREIRSLQPEGPYYIGGSSFGGLVAFEIAQQLNLQNERVALVALLDTGTPEYPKMLPSTTVLMSKAYQLIRRVQHHKDSLKAFNTIERSEYILQRLGKVKLKYRRKIRDLYKRAVRNAYSATKGINSIPKNYIQIEDLIWKAGQRYQPRPYPGSVTLFRASIQPLGIYRDLTLGWNAFVDGDLEVIEVPGHHGSIVAEPYVRVLAEKLKARLESVQRKERQKIGTTSGTEFDTRSTLFQKAAAGSVM